MNDTPTSAAGSKKAAFGHAKRWFDPAGDAEIGAFEPSTTGDEPVDDSPALVAPVGHDPSSLGE